MPLKSVTFSSTLPSISQNETKSRIEKSSSPENQELKSISSVPCLTGSRRLKESEARVRQSLHDFDRELLLSSSSSQSTSPSAFSSSTHDQTYRTYRHDDRLIKSEVMDVQAMFRRLLDKTPLTRNHEVLRNLRKRLKRVGGLGLPDGDHCDYFLVFNDLLQDTRWKTVCESTMLMVDLIPLLPDCELDHCYSLTLPKVIGNLGHFSTDVRRASLRLLHVYMRYTHNLQKVLKMYITHGLANHGDKSAQKGSILSIPLLFTEEEFSNENLFILVESLAQLLVTADTQLFYPVFLSLQRLQGLVGKERFRRYLTHVRPDAVLLYHRVLSRSATSSTGESTNGDDLLVSGLCDNKSHHHRKEDEFTDIHRMTTRHTPVDVGPPLDPKESAGPIGGASPSKSKKKQDIPRPAEIQPGLSYGIFPRLLIRRALSEKIPEQLDALRQILVILNEGHDVLISALTDHLHDFVKTFARALMDSPNYKVILYTLDILSAVVERLKLSCLGSSLTSMTALMIQHLGDSRSLVREHNIRVIHRLMYSLPAQVVLDNLLEHKYHRNAKVREEIVNRVTAAVLSFPKKDINLARLCHEVTPMLVDHKRVVRTAALESVAVLAHALGPINVDTIFSTVKAVQSSCDAYGLLMAVQSRLARRELARCLPDGTVRHVLNPINFASWLPSDDQDADIEWILLGSGTPTPVVCRGHEVDTIPKRHQHPSTKHHAPHPRVAHQVSFDLSNYSDSSIQSSAVTVRPKDFDVMSTTTSLSRKGRRHATRQAFQQMRFSESESSSTGAESYRSDDSRGLFNDSFIGVCSH